MKESKFLKIRCPKCDKNTIVFGKASTRVKCSICNTPLIKPGGGKAQVRALVEEVL
jgi:small subunit ribosomal protein S27e